MILTLIRSEWRWLVTVAAALVVPLFLVASLPAAPTAISPRQNTPAAIPYDETEGGNLALPSPAPTEATFAVLSTSPAPTVAPPDATVAAVAPSAPAVSLQVPILMYHHVGPLPDGADALRRDLTVSPQRFAEQVNYLVREGYQTVPMPRFVAALRGEDRLPPKTVILTFDDGYQDNHDHAFPTLQQAGYTGTFFIVTGLLGHYEYLTWAQVLVMADGGMDIQSHGRDHVDMSRQSPHALERQLAGSRQELAARLGRPVPIFAYPAGRYSPSVILALQAAGYEAALTTRHGSSHTLADAYELRRVRVRGSDTLQNFASKVRP